jgi:hypothetical protein
MDTLRHLIDRYAALLVIAKDPGLPPVYVQSRHLALHVAKLSQVQTAHLAVPGVTLDTAGALARGTVVSLGVFLDGVTPLPPAGSSAIYPLIASDTAAVQFIGVAAGTMVPAATGTIVPTLVTLTMNYSVSIAALSANQVRGGASLPTITTTARVVLYCYELLCI